MGGKTSAAMSQALGATAEDEDAGPDPEDTVNEALEQRMAARKMLTNASYFAFTATPKNKTLECSAMRCRLTRKARSNIDPSTAIR